MYYYYRYHCINNGMPIIGTKHIHYKLLVLQIFVFTKFTTHRLILIKNSNNRNLCSGFLNKEEIFLNSLSII